MSLISNHIHCDECDTLTETSLSDIKLNRFGRDFKFNSVETEVCPNCQEIYVPYETLKKCNSLIENQLSVGKRTSPKRKNVRLNG